MDLLLITVVKAASILLRKLLTLFPVQVEALIVEISNYKLVAVAFGSAAFKSKVFTEAAEPAPT
jgi:hypothetical protein